MRDPKILLLDEATSALFRYRGKASTSIGAICNYDGTFSFSSGAADYGFGKMEFTENGYTVDKITYSESVYDSSDNQIVSYFVNHESSTKEDFLSANNNQSEKKDATWYDFTDDLAGYHWT